MHTKAQPHIVAAAASLIRARQLLKPTSIADGDISAISQALFDVFNPQLEPEDVLTLTLEAWDEVYPARSPAKKNRPPYSTENTTHGRTMSPADTKH